MAPSALIWGPGGSQAAQSLEHLFTYSINQQLALVDNIDDFHELTTDGRCDARRDYG